MLYKAEKCNTRLYFGKAVEFVRLFAVGSKDGGLNRRGICRSTVASPAVAPHHSG